MITRIQFTSDAQWNSVILNSGAKFNQNIGIINIARHIENCITNPTIGILAEHTELTKRPKTKYYKNNYEIIHKQDKVHRLDVKLDDTIHQLYPKTEKARELLIKKDRIRLEKIVPILRSASKKRKLKINLLMHNIKCLLK